MPAAYKGEPWARLGVDIDNDFKPLYVVARRRRTSSRDLKQKLKEASELYLATDEDREGEAIAWHLLEVLNPPTDAGATHGLPRDHAARPSSEAIDEPRDLDRRLVDAQEARRILDRLYGYEVCPVLWKKVQRGLSAGRVQSVATRIVVERERERMRFVAAGYWDLDGTFAAGRAAADLRRHAGRRSTAAGWPPARTSTRTAGSPRDAGRARRGRRPRRWPTASTTPTFAVRSVEAQALHAAALRRRS